MNWDRSVRTHYKILDNKAHNEDEQIATWYMIPWINIQRHLHSERGLFIGFCSQRFCQSFLATTPFMHLFSLRTLSGFMDHSKYTDGFCYEDQRSVM